MEVRDSIFTRFGLGTEFEPDWFGRYNSYKAEIMSVSLNPSWACVKGHPDSRTKGTPIFPQVYAFNRD